MRTAASIALALISLPALAAAQEKPLAFTGARIVPIVGEEIASGTLVVQNGKILAVDLTGERLNTAIEAALGAATPAAGAR